jgi:hypothetical protein
MVRDWMDGEVATGRAGRLGVEVAGKGVAVSVATGTVGAAVAGMGEAVSVTAGAAEAGGKVAMVGRAAEPVLQAITVSRIARPPSSILKLRERIMTPLISLIEYLSENYGRTTF